MKLALVRARAPDFQGRLVGALEVPLSDDGREAARAAAAKLASAQGPVTVYHPDAGYAVEYAKELARSLLGATLREESELSELDLGLWQGLTEEEIALRHRSAFSAFRTDARAVVPPEAEEVEAAHDRLAGALERIRRRHRREDRLVVVVAPELAFVLLNAAARGEEAPPGLWEARRSGEDVRVF